MCAGTGKRRRNVVAAFFPRLWQQQSRGTFQGPPSPAEQHHFSYDGEGRRGTGTSRGFDRPVFFAWTFRLRALGSPESPRHPIPPSIVFQSLPFLLPSPSPPSRIKNEPIVGPAAETWGDHCSSSPFSFLVPYRFSCFAASLVPLSSSVRVRVRFHPLALARIRIFFSLPADFFSTSSCPTIFALASRRPLGDARSSGLHHSLPRPSSIRSADSNQVAPPRRRTTLWRHDW